MDACFKAFDKDEDLSLNINEFTELLKSLFRNEKGKPYPIDAYMCNELFMIFNQSGDGSMSKAEFAYCWNNWVKKIVRPVSAFIVVDVQNDFISGSLSISKCSAGHNGEEVVPAINKLVETVPFNVYAYSLDWHPADHLSFVDNVHLRKFHASSKIQDPSRVKEMDTVVFEGPPMTEQRLWPRHCVQNSWGAEFHKDLKVPKETRVIHKGINSNIDSYSAFFDNKKLGFTEMESFLRSLDVTDCYVCGIAYDVCVASTAFHAQELGFRTILIDDCSRGIDMEAINEAKAQIIEDHGLVVNSSEVKALVQGRDRRLELGYAWAIQCRKNILYPPKNRNSRYNPVKDENETQGSDPASQSLTNSNTVVAANA
ncbi:nicotinamidase-like isoform X1 [Tigriopus californicus]|uniref:nicotinamidase-like isoform X1 n=1 Tax=Tigriopus californicus TaxID=6832 RepID=UPI0027DA363F|nr:nicotinamidase-like isoform X1 [Tigriopus californicus]